MASAQAILYPKLRAFNLWSTHQGAGKTTAAIVATLSLASGKMKNVGYAKPASVGEKNERQKLIRFMQRWREGKAMPKWFTSKPIYHETAETSQIFHSGRTLKGTGQKLRSEGYMDAFDKDVLLKGVRTYARFLSDYVPSERGLPPAGSWLFFETLGGVDTYLPFKTPQADLYRELRLPGLLVTDGRPGGLQKTIEAFEYLRCRGHDVQGAFVFKGPGNNHEEIAAYFDENDVRCAVLRQVPDKQETDRKDMRVMMDYYKGMGRTNTVKDLIKFLDKRHSQRVQAKEKGVPDPKEEELNALVLATQADRDMAERVKEREAERALAEEVKKREAEEVKKREAENQVARNAARQTGRPRPSGPSQNARQATPFERNRVDAGRRVAPPRRHEPAARAGGGDSPRNHRDPNRPESRSQGSRSAGGYGDRSAPPGRYDPATRSGGGGYADRNEQARQARRPEARSAGGYGDRAAPRRFESAERSGGGGSGDRRDSTRPDSRGRVSRTERDPRQRAAPPRRHEPTGRSGGGSSGDYRERRTHTGPPSRESSETFGGQPPRRRAPQASERTAAGGDRSRFAGKSRDSGKEHRPRKFEQPLRHGAHAKRGSRSAKKPGVAATF